MGAAGSPASDRLLTRDGLEGITFPRVAAGVGILVAAVGVILLGAAAADFLQPGVHHDARRSLLLTVQASQGAIAAACGSVLEFGARYVQRREGMPNSTSRGSTRPREVPPRIGVFAFAAILVAGIVVVAALPRPLAYVAFSLWDFDPLDQPTNVTTYGEYRVSRLFWAERGSILTASIRITWTHNRTGAVLFGGAPGSFEVYVASASSPRASPAVASSYVVPANGFYVLDVWIGRCITPWSGECANSTAVLHGELRIEKPTVYLPFQIFVGSFGSALAALSAAVSRLAHPSIPTESRKPR